MRFEKPHPQSAEGMEAEGRRRAALQRDHALLAAIHARLDNPDDPFAHLEDDLDDAPVVAPQPPAASPERVLLEILRPITRARDSQRRAERAVTQATTRWARERAVATLGTRAVDRTITTALAADLDAERTLLMPIVRAAVAGTHPRWRLCRGRIIDDKGVPLQPQCLRPWQVL